MRNLGPKCHQCALYSSSAHSRTKMRRKAECLWYYWVLRSGSAHSRTKMRTKAECLWHHQWVLRSGCAHSSTTMRTKAKTPLIPVPRNQSGAKMRTEAKTPLASMGSAPLVVRTPGPKRPKLRKKKKRLWRQSICSLSIPVPRSPGPKCAQTQNAPGINR